jgi:uncharacterized membrane protein
MTNLKNLTAIMTLSLLPVLTLIGCQSEQQVSFAQDVQPIVQKHCLECHVSGGPGLESSGFAMDSYEGLMKGTRNGPMIIAGDSAGSNMLVLMEGRADPSIRMPHGKMEGASGKEIETIRAWIDQGAKNN